MPSKTFLQLDPEKQSKFMEAALKEFSTKDYQRASISNLVAELGIAKGSVYQYFKDKKSLYIYLLEQAAAMKYTYLQKAIAASYDDFWDLCKKMFISGIAFDLEQPRQSSLLLLSLQEKQVEELAAIALGQRKRAWEMMQGLLSVELAAARLRSDLALSFMAWQVIAISLGIAEYLTLNYGIDYLENARNNGSAYTLSEQELMETVDGMIAVLKNGMVG